MDLQEIDSQLIEDLLGQAKASERLRVAYDLRTTSEDTSQRMLNCLEPGTEVPIHQHEETSETNICIVGRLDVVFYDMGADGKFVESSRVGGGLCSKLYFGSKRRSVCSAEIRGYPLTTHSVLSFGANERTKENIHP